MYELQNIVFFLGAAGSGVISLMSFCLTLLIMHFAPIKISCAALMLPSGDLGGLTARLTLESQMRLDVWRSCASTPRT